jgi:hypothetical protein
MESSRIYKNRNYLGAASFWGKDTQPQKRCLKYGQENNFSCFMATQEKTRSYYSFRNYKQFETYFKSIKTQRNWHELIRPDLPVKLFFDYDERTTSVVDQSHNDKIILTMHELLDKNISDYEPNKMVILNGSRQCDGYYKISFHFIYNSSDCFESIFDLKLFVQTLDLSNEILKNIDTKIYTKNRLFRTIFSSKKGEDVKLLPFYDNFKFNFLDTMVQYFDTDLEKNQMFIEIDEVPNKKLHLNKVENISPKNMDPLPKGWSDWELPTPKVTPKVTKNSENLDVSDIVSLFYQYQQQHWNEIRYEFRDVQYPFINFNTIIRKKCFCSLCNRTHENENEAVIKINFDNSAYLFCRKNPAERNYIKHVEATQSEILLNETLPYEIDPRAAIMKDQNDIIYNSRFVKDIDLNKNYFIKSQLGTGKTFAFTNLIIKLLRKNPKAKILILSQRIQYAREIHSKINRKLIDEGLCSTENPLMGLYKDHNKKLIESKKIPRGYVMGVHSLDKFEEIGTDPDLYNWDLVIGDEIRSIFCEFCQRDLMSKRFFGNASKLELLFKQAKQFIVCDAFVTQSDITKMNFFRKDFQLIVNNWIPKPRKLIRMEYTDMESQLRQFLLQGKKCVYHHTSKSKLLKSNILEWCENNGITYKYYSADSDDNTKSTDFENINKSWCVDLLIYTPTITVGVSFDKLHFDYLFVYMSTYSSLVRDTIQSMHRVRNFKNDTIYCNVFEKKNTNEGLPLTRKCIEYYLSTNKRDEKKFYAKYYFAIEWVDHNFGWISESVYNYMHEKAWHTLRINQMLDAYLSMCNIKQTDVEGDNFFFDSITEQNTVTAVINSAVISPDNFFEFNHFLKKYNYENIDSLTYDSYWQKLELVKSNKATFQDKIEILKFEFQKNFDDQMFNLILSNEESASYTESMLNACFENWLQNPKHIDNIRTEKEIKLSFEATKSIEEGITICMNEAILGTKQNQVGFIFQIPKTQRQIEFLHNVFNLLGIENSYDASHIIHTTRHT